MSPRDRQAGSSLLELLIVALVVGLLAAAALSNLLGRLPEPAEISSPPDLDEATASRVDAPERLLPPAAKPPPSPPGAEADSRPTRIDPDLVWSDGQPAMVFIDGR